ncbi:MAG: porin [Candidatus Competibacter sp.]|nr:porin [Candidatus Competibacter sp.]MDG4583472.1 porin [Candidatus Competibacter sp.]
MKKSAIALAIAAALVGTSAFADTTLYGSARVSVDYTDLDTTYSGLRAANGSLIPVVKGFTAWDVVNDSSRLGVRGEEDLGGGLSAIYQYEFGVDVTEGGNFNSNRPKWVGLKGSSWGSVTLGTQWTPYYNVLGVSDVFNNSATTFLQRTGYLGSIYGTRMDNSLLYSSPNWSGFGFQAMLVMNGDIGANEPQTPSQLAKCNPDNRLPCNLSSSVDMYQLNATYKNGPWFAGVAYMAVDGPGFGNYFNNPNFGGTTGAVKYTAPNWDGDQWGLAFGYNSGPFAVTINFEDGDLNTLNYGTTQNLYLTGAYTFGNNIIRGAYGYSTPDKGQVPVYVEGVQVGRIDQDDINTFVLGYQYNFSKRTRAWVEYTNSDVDSDLWGTQQVLSIGTRVDF